MSCVCSHCWVPMVERPGPLCGSVGCVEFTPHMHSYSVEFPYLCGSCHGVWSELDKCDKLERSMMEAGISPKADARVIIDQTAHRCSAQWHAWEKLFKVPDSGTCIGAKCG